MQIPPIRWHTTIGNVHPVPEDDDDEDEVADPPELEEVPVVVAVVEMEVPELAVPELAAPDELLEGTVLDDDEVPKLPLA